MSLDDVTHALMRALEARRAAKMAESVHAFLRGNTEAFYARLERHTLPKGPPIWICGDLHVGNIGPLADARGDVALEIRDLDQAVVGNPAYDVVRLAFSLATTARDANLRGRTTIAMLAALVHGYATGLDQRRAPARPDVVRFEMKKALRQKWRKSLEERGIEHARLPRTGQFRPLTREAHAAARDLVMDDPARTLTALQDERDHAPRVHFRDAAFWVKGCSSLGRARVAVLASIDDRLALLDVKEARRPCVPAMRRSPRDEGERVVLGARAVAPNLGERMFAGKLLRRSVFVRELLPQDLKLELEDVEDDEASRLAAYLGHVVGRAHGRQLDASARRAWQRALVPPKSAPIASWLWTVLTDLLSRQASAYLNHCAALTK